ncbi:GNAT family N-acetyltransferase [Microbacterium sp. USHLN186]|uniref:GNAT family N-acetyltransferase n=1 Tax=Microbacterium sp. USHLN186 TaxID=3081286 RepID=UPI003017B383
MSVVVRRVRADEWRRARDLRLEAVRDPAARIAFLHSYEEEAAREDAFWQSRARGAAVGAEVAQFVAESGEDWVGTLSVLRREAGTPDHHGRIVETPRADVVGVYVRPDSRGEGTIEALFDAAAQWTRRLGDGSLMLDVHVDNVRAQAAYRRCGFAETGLRFTGSIGPELEMAFALDADAAGEGK